MPTPVAKDSTITAHFETKTFTVTLAAENGKFYKSTDTSRTTEVSSINNVPYGTTISDVTDSVPVGITLNEGEGLVKVQKPGSGGVTPYPEYYVAKGNAIASGSSY